MNITVLAAIVLAAALVNGGVGPFWSTSRWSDNVEGPQSTIQPCQQRSSRDKFKDFVSKHVLTKSFNRTDLKKWAQ